MAINNFVGGRASERTASTRVRPAPSSFSTNSSSRSFNKRTNGHSRSGESSGSDSVMTPNLNNGEVFHSPGPIAIAMLQDMMLKPPPGIPLGIPAVPRNVKALVGDKSALLYFDPPTNARISQVTSYKVHISPTGEDRLVTSSPALITGLKNGATYSFSINAINTAEYNFDGLICSSQITAIVSGWCQIVIRLLFWRISLNTDTEKCRYCT